VLVRLELISIQNIHILTSSRTSWLSLDVTMSCSPSCISVLTYEKKEHLNTVTSQLVICQKLIMFATGCNAEPVWSRQSCIKTIIETPHSFTKLHVHQNLLTSSIAFYNTSAIMSCGLISREGGREGGGRVIWQRAHSSRFPKTSPSSRNFYELSVPRLSRFCRTILEIQCVPWMRKRPFKGTSGATFLRHYRALHR
jgi:hypothetical protein